MALLGAAPSVSRRSPVSGLVACSPTHSSEVVSYKSDSLAFTKVNRSLAIHSNPGIHCNKERQMSARKNPARTCLTPARPDHSDRKRKDKTTDNRQSPLAAPSAGRITSQTRRARDSLILSRFLSQQPATLGLIFSERFDS